VIVMDIVCEHSFDQEDQKHPGYSFTEMDFYRWIPASKRAEVRNHMLTLRKNLLKNEYELVRHYHDDEEDVVIFTFKNFQDALDQVVTEWNCMHDGWAGKHDPIRACNHLSLSRSFCFAEI
jgi:hypothetical protein